MWFSCFWIFRFRVSVLGFRVFLGFRVYGFGILGFGVWGLGGFICALLEREARERLERKDTKGRCSDSHISGDHLWNRPRFGYVVHLTTVYILTGGIV